MELMIYLLVTERDTGFLELSAGCCLSAILAGLLDELMNFTPAKSSKRLSMITALSC